MHALRHFYASAPLDTGESLKTVSEHLGHSDPAMTLRVYAHLMPSSKERAWLRVFTHSHDHCFTDSLL
jgi:integrase